MQQAIEAALIGGGAAASVAIVGTITTALTTARTLRANREMAGEGRLWAKTSEVYELVLAYTTYRQLVRDHNTSSFRLDDATTARITEQLNNYGENQPDFITLDAKIRAYASNAVLVHFNDARQAELAVSQIDAAWASAREAFKANPGGPEAASLPSFKPRLDEARAKADTTLIDLGEAVRQELREGHLRTRRWFGRQSRHAISER